MQSGHFYDCDADECIKEYADDGTEEERFLLHQDSSSSPVGTNEATQADVSLLFPTKQSSPLA